MITRVLWNLLWIPRDDTSRGWLPGRKIPSYTYSGCVACTALSLMGQRRVEQKMKLLRLSWKAKGNFLYIRQLFLSSMVNRTERATLFAMSRCCCCNCIFYFLCHHQCGIQFLSSGLLTMLTILIVLFLWPGRVVIPETRCTGWCVYSLVLGPSRQQHYHRSRRWWWWWGVDSKELLRLCLG